MLELDDIQHFLFLRQPALAARYEFLTFQQPAAGRAWLAGMIDEVGTAASARAASSDDRWVSLAFTWSGLRALGVEEAALATFPEEFRQGMAARASILGATGTNHPDHWVGGLTTPALHGIAVLFARDVAERERARQAHARFLSQIGGVDVLSGLDLEAISQHEPREHFGYLDRRSEVVIKGTGEPPAHGWGPPVEAGEFFLGYPDESGARPALPQPEILSKNGSYLAYMMLQEHVGVFREFLRQHGRTREEQEMVAAKLMGRWRSGAPLVLSPHHDDPALGADLARANDFDYGTMDPHGYACPIGAHIRRMNPRDTAENLQRRRMIRRGGTYGPALPEDAPDDGVDRGVAAFLGCASLVRQFEFAMNVWVNDPSFQGLGNERDPIIGTQDGTFDMTIQGRAIRRKITGLPAFTTLRAGAYFFLPGIRALRWLASGNRTIT
ncbi:Dyp-type peroxidase [Polyangium aurulentum]|uniref:Dyp-type peroxidase n=1 Tax=Polyangium aurulentum TaxID=2567896 RepID=UPI0010AE73D6|nr:peroxidase [Polyangium aurulentum]UQA59764.1 peroxidase [Polyangium aurulentum]